MSFITSPGVIVPPLTAGAVAYGTGSQAFVNNAGTAGQVLRSAGAGVPVWATSTAGIPVTVPEGGTSLTTLTANNVILGNGAAAPTFVAPGTTANVLTSNGTTWSSSPLPPSGMTFIAAYDATGASSVDIENAFSAYDNYIIKGSNITCSSNQLFLRTKVGGSYITQSYSSFDAKGDAGYVVWQIYNITVTTYASIALSGNYFNFTLYASNLNNQNGAAVKPMTGQIVGDSGTHVFYARGDSTAAVTGIRIYAPSVNFDAGKFYLYGLAKS